MSESSNEEDLQSMMEKLAELAKSSRETHKGNVESMEQEWKARKESDSEARGSKQSLVAQAKTISLLKRNKRIQVLNSEEVARLDRYVDPVLASKIRRAMVVEDVTIDFNVVCTRVDSEKATFGKLSRTKESPKKFPSVWKSGGKVSADSCHSVDRAASAEEVKNICLTVKLLSPTDPTSQQGGKRLNISKVFSMVDAIKQSEGSQLFVEWDNLIQMKRLASEENEFIVPEDIDHPMGNSLGLIMALPNSIAINAQKMSGKLYSVLPEEVLAMSSGEMTLADMLDILTVADYAPDLNEWADSHCSHLEGPTSESDYNWLIRCLFPWAILSNQNSLLAAMTALRDLYSKGDSKGGEAARLASAEKLVKQTLQQFAVMHLLTRRYKYSGHEGISIGARKWRSMAETSYIKKMAVRPSFKAGKTTLDLDALKNLGVTVVDITPVSNDEAMMDLQWMQDVVLDALGGKLGAGSDLVVDNDLVYVKAGAGAGAGCQVVVFPIETLLTGQESREMRSRMDDLMGELVEEVEVNISDDDDRSPYPRFVPVKIGSAFSEETAQVAGLIMQLALSHRKGEWKWEKSKWWLGARKKLWQWLQEYRFSDTLAFGASVTLQVVDEGRKKGRGSGAVGTAGMIRASDLDSLLASLLPSPSPAVVSHARSLLEGAMATMSFPKFAVIGQHSCWKTLYGVNGGREEEDLPDVEYVANMSHTIHVQQLEFTTRKVDDAGARKKLAGLEELVVKGKGSTAWFGVKDTEGDAATVGTLADRVVLCVDKEDVQGDVVSHHIAVLLNKRKWLEFGVAVE